MVNDGSRQIARDVMMQLRMSFKKEDWAGTLENYKRTREVLKRDRALRLEATCLAARALAAQKNRAAARALLKPFAAEDYTKASHYEFLARAYLDLKQYKDAAQICVRAQSVRDTEVSK
jgi:hypothetical protein